MQHNPPLVLYVEDDGLLMNMYRELFTKHGFAFVGARDFESGKKLIVEKKPDLILLDLILPSRATSLLADLDPNLGLELLKDLKSDPETKHIPVIILTNLDESSVQRKTEILGADRFMVKANVLPKETLAAVRELLASRGVALPVDPLAKKAS